MEIEHGVIVLTPKDTAIPSEVRGCRNVSVRMWGFKHVDAISALPNISKLEVFRWPVDSFDALTPLRHLRTLHVRHFPKVHSLQAFQMLKELQDLELTTLASWYNKKQVVETFRPLSSPRNSASVAWRSSVSALTGRRTGP